MKPILKSKKIIFSILIMALILAGIITTVIITGSYSLRTTTKQLSLGEKYLSELEYDKAIVAFNKVIDIEPRNMKAYLGLCEAYVGLNQTDEAIRILENAIEVIVKSYEDTGVSPENSENIYLRLADMYENSGNREKAFLILKDGYSILGTNKLAQALKKYYPEVRVSVPSGNYAIAQTIELISDGERIYYTLNGSEPTKESEVYTEEILLEKGMTTLKAVAENEFGEFGEVSVYSYIIEEADEIMITRDYSVQDLEMIEELNLFPFPSQDDAKQVSSNQDDYEPTKGSLPFAIHESMIGFCDFSYEYIMGFSENIALVFNYDNFGNPKYGFINSEGIELVPCKYDIAYNFSDGMALVGIVKNNDIYYGYVNNSGEEVIECKFKYAEDFINGIAIVAFENNEYKLINDKGEDAMLANSYDYISNSSLRGELIAVANFNSNGSMSWGYINRDGKEIVTPKYEQVYEEGFNKGLAKVRYKGLYGYIDINGKEVIPTIYEDTDKDYITDGLILVKQNGKYGVIDHKGNIIITPKYDDAYMTEDEYTIVNLGYKEKNKGNTIYVDPGKWGIIDPKGKVIAEPKYDRISGFREGLACVNLGSSFPSGGKGGGGTSFVRFQGGKYGFINMEGNEVIPIEYDYATSFFEGMAVVEVDGKNGFINTKGEIVIPLKYDSAWEFNDGIAYVKKDNKMGYIDKDGNEVIPIIYDDMSQFEDGLLGVKLGSKWGFVNEKGEVVIPIRFDDSKYGGYYWFREGISKAVLGKKEIFINTRGENINELTGEDLGFSEISEGYRYYSVDQNEKRMYGYMDDEGNVLTGPIFDYASDVKNGIACIQVHKTIIFIRADSKAFQYLHNNLK